MNHKKIQLLISSYLDGEIKDTEEQKVREHLDICSECHQFVSNAREMGKEIRALGEVNLPYAFAERVAYVAKKNDEQGRDWLSIEPLARNTFFLIAVVVLLMFLLTSSNKSVLPGITDVLSEGSDKDSVVTQVLLQPGDLSKNDLLFAVMTK